MASADTAGELAAAIDARRPQRADARRNYDALVTAARDAFAREGTGASLEDIARRAEVGIGTLYRNFPTRDALIEAVYVSEVDALVHAAARLPGKDAWADFAAWLDRYVDYIGTKRVLVEGLNRDSPVLRMCRIAIYQAGGPLLERAQQAGEARKDATIDDVVRIISGIMGSDFPDRAQQRRVLGLAIDGVRAAARAAD